MVALQLPPREHPRELGVQSGEVWRTAGDHRGIYIVNDAAQPVRGVERSRRFGWPRPGHAAETCRGDRRDGPRPFGPLEELAIITEVVTGVDEVGGHVAADVLEHPINITPV